MGGGGMGGGAKKTLRTVDEEPLCVVTKALSFTRVFKPCQFKHSKRV